jgi:hypothetical protein
MKPGITLDRVKQMVRYDPDTGVFTRLVASGTAMVGDIAGSPDGMGYLRFRIDGIKYRAHRLAYFYMTGAWPIGEIDHKHGNRSDNRWSELRDGDRFQNQQNQRAASKISTTGLLGAARHGEKFMAQIRVSGTTKYIGVFKTPELAHQAYLTAKRALHAGCTI